MSSVIRDTASPQWVHWLRMGSLAAIVMSLIGIARLVPIERLLSLLTVQIEQLGYWGPVLFGILCVLVAILFVPGFAFTLAAGASISAGGR
jgi:uncharacterized membrane protein YdjX (TVP38/TMEM64 family)